MRSLIRTEDERLADDKVNFGFWVYLMTDCILFASFFATYAVLRNNTFGGPSAGDLFHLPPVLLETLILLTSSFTCGLAVLALRQEKVKQVIAWFSVTFLLGASFLFMELNEFRDLIASGNDWQRSGFLSAFFTLVGAHGIHIFVGLVWIILLMWQLVRKGLVRSTARRIMMLSIFWHFLDVIWIFIFTIVYLMGAIKL